MANLGSTPVDGTTDLGKLRANLGATQFNEFDPAIEGLGDFDYFSDVELATLLISGAGSITRATGLGYLQIAATAALTGVSIKTDDLAEDTRGRGETLLKVAQSWLSQADAEDVTANGHFEVIPFTPAANWRF